MLDLTFVDSVLDAYEPEAARLTSTWRNEVSDMLRTILKACAAEAAGLIEPDDTATPMQRYVTWASQYPRTDKTKTCGAQQANGHPCQRNPWTMAGSGHCRAHSSDEQQQAIDQLTIDFYRPLNEVMETPEFAGHHERIEKFAATKRAAAQGSS